MTEVQLALVIVAGLFLVVAYTRSDAVEFYLGSQSYGPLTSAMSLVAAFTGGGALLNTTGLASKYGNSAFFDVIPSVVGLLISAIFVVRGFFGKKFSSLFFDITSKVYDPKAVALHYLQVGFLYILVIAAQLRAVAIAADATKTPAVIAVLFCCSVVAVYAYRGFDAVTRTDLAQLILMIPMYIILAYIAFEPQTATISADLHATTEMPVSLILSLCLPVFFLPVSQEVHQRGATSSNDKTIAASYLIAAVLYGLLAGLLVFAFSRNPGLNITSLISGTNEFAAIMVAVGFFSAILSTLDTSTNIASHAVQKLRPFQNWPPALIQILLLFAGGVLFIYFKSVLALILFALFMYMAGPAFTFFSVYSGLHPRLASVVGTVFVALQSFVHFSLGKYVGVSGLLKAYALDDTLRVAIYLLVVQLIVLLLMLAGRRYRW